MKNITIKNIPDEVETINELIDWLNDLFGEGKQVEIEINYRDSE